MEKITAISSSQSFSIKMNAKQHRNWSTGREGSVFNNDVDPWSQKELFTEITYKSPFAESKQQRQQKNAARNQKEIIMDT